MPATGSRIQFVTQAYRIVRSETASVRTRHGSLARQHDEPVETFFADISDAQLIADSRQELLSPERRVFKVSGKGLDEVMLIDFTGGVTPTVDVVDAERSLDRRMMVGAVTLDFAKQSFEFETWG